VTVSKFIERDLSSFIGGNADKVGFDLEQAIDRSPYVFRWLEPETKCYPEFRADRININIDNFRTIISFRAG
jgi:hypothetical protein